MSESKEQSIERNLSIRFKLKDSDGDILLYFWVHYDVKETTFILQNQLGNEKIAIKQASVLATFINDLIANNCDVSKFDHAQSDFGIFHRMSTKEPNKQLIRDDLDPATEKFPFDVKKLASAFLKLLLESKKLL